jgi:hypothetical protein
MMRFVKALILLTIAAASGPIAPASAQEGVISSAVVYGGATQKRIVCYFTNQGGASVRLSNVSVFDRFGMAVEPVIDTCGGSAPLVLARGKSCERAADIISNAVYGCRAKVDDLAYVRGSVEIRDQNEIVLNSLPME